MPGLATMEIAEKNNPFVCLALAGKNGHLLPPGCALVPSETANML